MPTRVLDAFRPGPRGRSTAAPRRSLTIPLLCLSVVGLISGCRSPHVDSGPPASDPVIELDHVFVFAPQGSSEQDVVAVLEEAGLTVNPERNEFPDGVVGRYVFFANAYLEILWLGPDADTDAETRRAATWETSGASPFGIGLRRQPGAPDPLPFRSRAKTEEWMEPGTEMRLLNDASELLAPSLFVVPEYMAMPSWSDPGDDPASRPAQARTNVTGVRMVATPESVPQATDALIGTSVRIESGEAPLMELSIGSELQLQLQLRRTDLRPILPLVLLPDEARPARESR